MAWCFVMELHTFAIMMVHAAGELWALRFCIQYAQFVAAPMFSVLHRVSGEDVSWGYLYKHKYLLTLAYSRSRSYPMPFLPDSVLARQLAFVLFATLLKLGIDARPGY